MLNVAETYERLGPRVRSLAGVLYEDADVTSVGACIRLQGVDHEVRLERGGGSSLSLRIRASGHVFYRGPLAQWYGAVGRSGRTRKRAA